MLTDEELTVYDVRIENWRKHGVDVVPICSDHLEKLLRVYRAVQSGEWVLVPKEPGTCEGDDSGWVLAFLNALHAHLPEDERPTSWMQFSDNQRERIQAAYRAMLAAAPELEKP